MYLEPEPVPIGLVDDVADADVFGRCRFLLPLPVPLVVGPPLPIIRAKASLPPLLRFFLNDELLMLYTCNGHWWPYVVAVRYSS